MKIHCLILLFAMQPALAGLGQSAPHTDSLQAVQSALRAGDFAQALALSRAQLKHSPRDVRLFTFEGLAFTGLKQNSEALAAYDKALAIAPNYLPALQGAAQLEFEAGNAHAIPRLDRILQQLPNDPTSHAMLAVLAFKQHDCATAVKHFAQSTQLIAAQSGALAEYGSCLMDLERPADAASVFEQIVTRFPGDARARYDLAVAELAAHQGKAAVETLQPLLEAKDPDTDVFDLASSAYEDTGDTPKAVELLRHAIVLNPRKAKYYVDFAMLSFNHQSFQVGVDMVNVGLKELPKDASLYIARGILYMQMAQYDNGEADFATAAKIDPSEASGAVAESMALIQQSNLDQALATVEAQLSSHPKESFLYYLKAQILVQKGAESGSAEFKAAIDAATRAVQLQPDFVLPRDILGSLYLKSGQPDLAIEQCRMALRGNPSDQEALYHLIQALRQSGKGSKVEMAALVQKLADLRQHSREQEASANKYKLYEPGQPSTPPAPQ
jgi:tetratricopeptide (TPR) repeat protein